jgi:multiple antibiotic resistance protein
MDILKTIVSLFAIVDPIGAVPIFMSITAGRSAASRAKMARMAALAVLCLLVGSIFLGGRILTFFGISISAFRVAGGILLLLMAIAMLQAAPSATRSTPEETADAEEREGAAVVPIAMPLLAGPGSISTAVLWSEQCHSMWDKGILVLASLVIAASVLVSLLLANRIGRRLGRTGINVLTRLMGLLLAAIAVEFVVDGLGQLLPGLAVPRT